MLLECFHVVGRDGIENDPGETLTQLVTSCQQRLHTATVLPQVDKNHRRIQSPGQLPQAQAIQQTLMQTSGRLKQSDRAIVSAQLFPQALKTCAGIQAAARQAPIGRARRKQMQRRNQLRFV